MGLIKEFKEFVMRGNVIDMAVGIVTGAAFTKIVSSLVENIITPPLGYLINGVDFKQLSVKFQPLAIPGFKPPAPVEMKYGLFLQALFDFIIVAFVLFMVLRTINRIKRLAEITPPPKPDVPPEPTKEEKLLTEIRDLMKEQLAKS